MRFYNQYFGKFLLLDSPVRVICTICNLTTDTHNEDFPVPSSMVARLGHTDGVRIDAADARLFLLYSQGLLDDPGRRCTPGQLQKTIKRMGFVQIDSIQSIARAHHLILSSRFDEYQPSQLTSLFEKKRTLFEHWTHDASLIPTAYFPMWKARFVRPAIKGWWKRQLGARPKRVLEDVLARVRDEGPMKSADFTNGLKKRKKGSSAWWGWHPQKTALEYLCRSGDLATTKRINFHKVYDLTERVYPEHLTGETPTHAEYVDWACNEAVTRLGFATPREIAGFWGYIHADEVRKWCTQAEKSGELIPIKISPAKKNGLKPQSAYALHNWKTKLSRIRTKIPSHRIRLICPFDPVIHDRKRTEYLFDFTYRFEAFVPKHKRVYGYYVLPMLEGDHFVGRIAPKFHRESKTLEIKGVWWEQGVQITKKRKKMLDEAIQRLAGFVGAHHIEIME